MCDPTGGVATAIAIGSSLASAGGAYFNASEQAANQKRMMNASNQATLASIAKQHQYQADAGAVFDSTLNKFTPDAQNTQLTNTQNQTAQTISGNAPTAAMIGGISTGNAPRVVGANENAMVGSRLARAFSHGTDLAKLSGYDRSNMFNNENIAQSGQDMSGIISKSRGEAGLLPVARAAAANNAYKPPSGLGDLLGALGQVGSYGAGRGWFDPASNPLTVSVSNPHVPTSMYG